jgi:phenylalanyl-tRNA synthetase beta chain
MKAPLSWLREYADLPEDLSGRALAARLISAGLEVETVEQAGADVTGPLVVGRVLSYEVEQHANGKSIRYCRVDVGTYNEPGADSRGIVCGAHNFAAGDLVVVALPGAELPGGMRIAARRTYGHVSDGMICSARELGLGEDHTGILVLHESDLVPGVDAASVLHLRDEVLDIAVTPDRGYCLSIRGLAREAAQALDVAFQDPVDRATPAPRDAGYPVGLASPGCPLFVAVGVDGIDPNRPSPRWLARRVQLAGMRSISLSVDITNYVMLETGQPLHAYDAARLQGPIVVRQAEPGERLTTLDGVSRQLDPGDLLITDGSGPIGLAGVMGGASTEMGEGTTSVVIEAAHFDALTVARTSRRHKLSSEASRRFERGVDPHAAYAAAHRAAELLVELGGGTLGAAETVVGTPPVPAATVMATDLPSRILGTPVAEADVVALIQRIGCAVEVEDDRLRMVPPSWRPDLRDPYDYVEEVGRLVGFETIQPVVPRAPVGRGLTRSQRARRQVNAALAGAGHVEVLTFPFASESDLDRMGVPKDDDRRRLVTILNPLSEATPHLRTTLLPGLFAAVARNTSRGNDDLALFETGLVFFAAEPAVSAPRPPVDRRPGQDVLAQIDAALGRQPRHTAAVFTGWWRQPGPDAPGQPVSWRHAVAFAEAAGRSLGINLERRAGARAPWHPGRCAQLLVAGREEVIGTAGEIHPSVSAAFGLPARTCAVEIDLDALIAASPERGSVAALSSYPVAKEDVALVVDREVPQEAVRQALIAGAGPLLESVRLFDVYTGPQVGPEQKSLAYSLRFRAPDRTLTEAEAGAARDAAVAAATAATGAVQRL